MKDEKHIWKDEEKKNKGWQVFVIVAIFLLIITIVVGLSEAKELTAKEKEVKMMEKKAIIEAGLGKPIKIKEHKDNKIKIKDKIIYEIEVDNKKWLLITQ